jgi:DNA-binding protein H-NS
MASFRFFDLRKPQQPLSVILFQSIRPETAVSKSLAQLNREIEKLKRQAEALRRKEAAGVIARIKEAIEHYDLTAEDLGLSGKAARRTAAEDTTAAKKTRRRAAKKKPGVIRFRDEAGNTWTGHGKRPGWFKAAIEAGKTPEDLAV